MADEAKTPAQVRYPRGSGNTDHLHPKKEQRNRDLNPHPVRRSKDAQDWTDLVLNAPPLYIQQQAHTGCPG